jgi:predicted transcriptional regulator
MPTTTIRLPEELKERVARAAKRVGTTSHAFILDAVTEKVGDEERRNEFYDTAEGRYAEIVSSGKTIPWDEMKVYLEDRVANKKARKPRARKLAR